MGQDNKGAIFVIVILLGIFLQIFLIQADSMDSPSRAVIEFSKAYFTFDTDMSDRLCSRILENEDVIGDYIYNAGQEASAKGYDIGFLKQSLSHIHTEIVEPDDTSVRIHLTAKRRTGINPAFTWVATLFRLGQTHEVDEYIDVVQEDGQWKVCGSPFSLLTDV
ncbi:MAG: hypothetical protein HKM93_13740 [Desulfobacteraceae bacterium]|nr:hypothetical protein [Desulfobacteraceae bacterium]